MARYREIWQVFPLEAHVKLDLRGSAKFDPRAIFWALSVEAY